MASTASNYRQVPKVQAYPDGRRGSYPFVLRDDVGLNSPAKDPDPSDTPSLIVPSEALYNDSLISQMDHSVYKLQFLESVLQENPLPYITDQLHHLKDLLQSSLTKVERTIALRTSPPSPQPVPSKPPSMSTALTPGNDRYHCLICKPATRRGYTSRGTLKRHIGQAHFPMVEYHCHIPGCLFKSYRKDKAQQHRKRTTGHIISRASSAYRKERFDKQMPPPQKCCICQNSVTSWPSWFNCVAQHCRLSESTPASSIRGGVGDREDDGDYDMSNGSSGGNSNSSRDQHQNHSAMGSKHSGNDLVFNGAQFGINGGYRCAGASHSPDNGPVDVPQDDQFINFLAMDPTETILGPIGVSSPTEQNNEAYPEARANFPRNGCSGSQGVFAFNSFVQSPKLPVLASPNSNTLETFITGPSTNNGKHGSFLKALPLNLPQNGNIDLFAFQNKSNASEGKTSF